MKKTLLSLIAVLVLTACGEITIDGSTEKTYKESIKKLTDNLPIKKSKDFKEAISSIQFSEAMKKYSLDAPEIKNSMILDSRIELITVLNGKNADEIIKIGKVVGRKIDCELKESTIATIEKLIPLHEERGNTKKVEELEDKFNELENHIINNCN